jgi:SAM-dependent methyltransferase
LAEISPDFRHVVGFDLTLPVLATARHLLDGKSTELMLPRAINELGRITLRNGNPETVGMRRELLAMDAFDTAFADGSVDCVITSFLIDLIPDPRKLAHEIHRILRPNGVWINYGPSGPLGALWRFDQSEGASFFQASGFCVVQTDACRATYLDLSRDCPTWSFQNHMCYLISARKTGQSDEIKNAAVPGPAELAQSIPEHFPAAILVRRERLDEEHKQTVQLRHERKPGVAETLDIGSDTARIIALVDGKRAVLEIANILRQTADLPVEETIAAFAGYFNRGLLSWRARGDEASI